jgi:hypothetical protein
METMYSRARLDELVRALGPSENADLRDVLEIEWEDSTSCFPESGLPFLAPQAVVDACRLLSLPAGAQEALLAVAGEVAVDPVLSALAWHMHYCAFRSQTYPFWETIPRWPPVESISGLLEGDGRTFYLLILTSELPGMRAVYETRRIPQDVFSEALIQLKDDLAHLYRSEAVWGLALPSRIRWYRFALLGELYRLGRIQFQFGSFRFPVRVFRHHFSRVVVALSEGQVAYLPNGQADGPGRMQPTGRWTSELIEAGAGVTGHPILPSGRALRSTVHLPAAEWQPVLARGDPALYLHFPEGGPLAHDLCGASLRRAIPFFAQYFADRPWTCFCCGSWVLNSRLQDLLPPTSNMIRFQKEVYLLPAAAHDNQLVDRIFGEMPEDLDKAPRDTALQRALLDRLAAGEHDDARAGACFMLPEDLDWGRQVYLRQKLPWVDKDGSAEQ